MHYSDLLNAELEGGYASIFHLHTSTFHRRALKTSSF